MLKRLFSSTTRKQAILAEGYILPDQARCVQCGICSFNCPIGIDVRAHAYLGLPVEDSRCLTCGECVERCPRGVLAFAIKNQPVLTQGGTS